MEMIFRFHCAAQRPLFFAPPIVFTHDEDTDRCFLHDAVIDPLEPVIVPAQLDRSQIAISVWSKIYVADFPHVLVMAPRTDDKVVFVSKVCWSVSNHLHVIVYRVLLNLVVPAGNVQGWNLHLRILTRSQFGHAWPVCDAETPVFVMVRMIQEVMPDLDLFAEEGLV